jgi:hypothetical protein
MGEVGTATKASRAERKEGLDKSIVLGHSPATLFICCLAIGLCYIAYV